MCVGVRDLSGVALWSCFGVCYAVSCFSCPKIYSGGKSTFGGSAFGNRDGLYSSFSFGVKLTSLCTTSTRGTDNFPSFPSFVQAVSGRHFPSFAGSLSHS